LAFLFYRLDQNTISRIESELGSSDREGATA